MSGQERQELLELLSSLCDDSLSVEQRARLEVLLADEECRRVYVAYMNLHARLLTHPRWSAELVQPADGESPQSPATAPNPPSRRRWKWYVAAAAAVLLLATAAWIGWTARNPSASDGGGEQAEKVTSPEYVASLSYAAGCEWGSAPGLTTLGGRFLPGDLTLRRGVAVIRFDGGVELLCEGPLDLRIESANAATLRAGRVVFRTDPSAAPFVLRTRDSVLRDQGTEYAVRVGPTGEEVHVFDGEVLRTARNDARVREVVPAGQARRYDNDTDAGSRIGADPNQLIRLPAQAGPGDDRDGLVAYEGFDYKSPDLQGTVGGPGGTGWIGPWKMDPVLKPVKLNPRGLDFPPARVSPVGGCIDSSGVTIALRQPVTPIRMDRDAIYYVSFLFRYRVSDPSKEHSMNLSFRKAGDPAVEKRLRIGVGPHAPVVYVQYEGGTVRLPLPLSPDKAYLMVAKIVAGRERPDQVMIRVYGPDEPADPDEPKVWSAVTRSFHSDEVYDHAGVYIRSASAQAIDEIRIGTTWRSVTGWATSRPAEVVPPQK